MRVKLITNVGWPLNGGVIVPAGTTLDVPEETAADWIKRGLAVEPSAPAPPPPPPPQKQKGKR